MDRGTPPSASSAQRPLSARSGPVAVADACRFPHPASFVDAELLEQAQLVIGLHDAIAALEVDAGATSGEIERQIGNGLPGPTLDEDAAIDCAVRSRQQTI